MSCDPNPKTKRKIARQLHQIADDVEQDKVVLEDYDISCTRETREQPDPEQANDNLTKIELTGSEDYQIIFTLHKEDEPEENNGNDESHDDEDDSRIYKCPTCSYGINVADLLIRCGPKLK